MTLKHSVDSVIFDLDGTLWDATGTVARAWQKAKEQVDYIEKDLTQEDVRSITGMTYDAIYNKLFPYLTEVQRQEFKQICAREELALVGKEGGSLYEGLEETLTYLKSKYRLFIVSNCQCGYIEAFLEYSGLQHYFDDHQCYGTKNQPKALNIKDVVERNELKAPVYIGDTLGDYEAAKGAKVPFIFVSYGFGKVENGQEATAEKVSDLMNIL